jgi:hypothetical protein
MRMVLVVAMLASGGCANVHVNRGALIASTAVLACDWVQTRKMANAGWGLTDMESGHQREQNPLMGPAPTALTVDGYFAVTAGLNALIWLVVPARFKSLVPVAVMGFEQDTIRHNVPNTGMCGI